MFAILFSLFQTEIKENFTASILHTPSGLADGGRFFGYGGEGVQLTAVGGSPISRMYNGVNYNLDYPRTLGYQDKWAFPPCQSSSKEGYVAPEKCYRSGVDSGRNIQSAPPPRFMNTITPSERYAPVDTAKWAVNLEKPIDHAEDLVISPFGQMQRDSRRSNQQDIQENYDNYATASVDLPKDMCNVNMLGSESQPVIYDRVMYSNIRSRLRGQGDYIRGDLMIAPDNYKPNGGGHPQWFQVSVKPERDLNSGCMEHLFGRKEEIALGLAEADIDIASFGL
jgi:hypothetical protein